MRARSQCLRSLASATVSGKRFGVVLLCGQKARQMIGLEVGCLLAATSAANRLARGSCRPARAKSTADRSKSSSRPRRQAVVAIILIIGELKGDEGRTARDRAMLLGEVAEPGSYIKVVLGFERKGKTWIEKQLAGETDPAERALAKRGAHGKTKCIKLSAEEKQVAQMYDSVM